MVPCKRAMSNVTCSKVLKRLFNLLNSVFSIWLNNVLFIQRQNGKEHKPSGVNWKKVACLVRWVGTHSNLSMKQMSICFVRGMGRIHKIFEPSNCLADTYKSIWRLQCENFSTKLTLTIRETTKQLIFVRANSLLSLARSLARSHACSFVEKSYFVTRLDSNLISTIFHGTSANCAFGTYFHKIIFPKPKKYAMLCVRFVCVSKLTHGFFWAVHKTTDSFAFVQRTCLSHMSHLLCIAEFPILPQQKWRAEFLLPLEYVTHDTSQKYKS